MNLNQLKYFYKVCLYGSLSEAAENLYISQPSLSSAIKSLENEFGIILFNRTHRGMKLTPAGNALFQACKDFLFRAEQLENIMKDLGSQRSKLRLGIPPMIGSLILPRIYHTFCKEHPEIQLEIIEDGRNELLHKLSENLLDMVFLLQNSPLDASFSSMHVKQLEIVCCVTRENPVANHSFVTPQILKDVPLVLFENSFFQTEKIKSWFAMAETEPNIIMQTKQLSTLLTMISQNVAAGFMFRELTQTNEGFVAIPTKEPMYADVSLVWNRDSYNSNSMKLFKKCVQDKNPFVTI